MVVLWALPQQQEQQEQREQDRGADPQGAGAVQQRRVGFVGGMDDTLPAHKRIAVEFSDLFGRAHLPQGVGVGQPLQVGPVLSGRRQDQPRRHPPHPDQGGEFQG